MGEPMMDMGAKVHRDHRLHLKALRRINIVMKSGAYESNRLMCDTIRHRTNDDGLRCCYRSTKKATAFMLGAISCELRGYKSNFDFYQFSSTAPLITDQECRSIRRWTGHWRSISLRPNTSTRYPRLKYSILVRRSATSIALLARVVCNESRWATLLTTSMTTSLVCVCQLTWSVDVTILHD